MAVAKDNTHGPHSIGYSRGSRILSDRPVWRLFLFCVDSCNLALGFLLWVMLSTCIVASAPGSWGRARCWGRFPACSMFVPCSCDILCACVAPCLGRNVRPKVSSIMFSLLSRNDFPFRETHIAPDPPQALVLAGAAASQPGAVQSPFGASEGEARNLGPSCLHRDDFPKRLSGLQAGTIVQRLLPSVPRLIVNHRRGASAY